MLEQQSGGQGIDVPLSAACGTAHLPDGSQRSRGRESLVHETHGRPGSFLELGCHVAGFHRPSSVLTVLVERQSHHIPLDFQLRATPNHLGNWRPLASPSLDEPDG